MKKDVQNEEDNMNVITRKALRIIKKLSMSLLICCFTVFANAQNKIEGRVIDENKNPVPYASVFCEKENAGTVTNTEGLFTLNLADTKNVVKISHTGYNSQEKILTGKEIIELVPVVYEIETITDVRNILSKVIANYRINTHSKPVDYIVNIREFQQMDNEYVKAVDATGRISIPDNRRLDDIPRFQFEAFDAKTYSVDKGFKTTIKPLFAMYLTPSRFVRYLRRRAFESDATLRSFYQDNKLVYEINFNSLNNRTKNRYKGSIYIDAETYAVKRLKITQDKTASKPSITVYKGQKLADQTKQTDMDIIYTKIEGKYHISFFNMRDEFSVGDFQCSYDFSMSFSNLPDLSTKKTGIKISRNKDLYTQLNNSELNVNTSSNTIMPTNKELKLWQK